MDRTDIRGLGAQDIHPSIMRVAWAATDRVVVGRMDDRSKASFGSRFANARVAQLAPELEQMKLKTEWQQVEVKRLLELKQRDEAIADYRRQLEVCQQHHQRVEYQNLQHRHYQGLVEEQGVEPRYSVCK